MTQSLPDTRAAASLAAALIADPFYRSVTYYRQLESRAAIELSP